MKKIYIIISQSGTKISKILRFFSKKDYNHSSIALDKSLDEFYSFGRKKVNNFLDGGFIIEHKNTGVFKKWPNTPCIIIEKEISDEQFNSIKNTIENNFLNKKDSFKYNFIGVPLVNTKIKIDRNNKFFCSSFVAYVLNSAGINTIKDPNHMEPIDFLKLENSRIIYKGLLQEYNI